MEYAVEAGKLVVENSFSDLAGLGEQVVANLFEDVAELAVEPGKQVVGKTFSDPAEPGKQVVAKSFFDLVEPVVEPCTQVVASSFVDDVAEPVSAALQDQRFFFPRSSTVHGLRAGQLQREDFLFSHQVSYFRNLQLVWKSMEWSPKVDQSSRLFYPVLQHQNQTQNRRYHRYRI